LRAGALVSPAAVRRAGQLRDGVIYIEQAMDAKQFQKISKALADPRRYQILSRIARCKEKELACSDMRCQLPISAATLSHHVKELVNAGLVEVRRQGQFAHMKLRRNVWSEYLSHLRKL
jgi:ArsR family transcriptional regulator, arsenate/arsenite/antimonite-responsive transcriptional repressor